MGIIEIDFKCLEDKIANSPSSPTFGQEKKRDFDYFDAVAFSFHF